MTEHCLVENADYKTSLFISFWGESSARIIPGLVSSLHLVSVCLSLDNTLHSMTAATCNTVHKCMRTGSVKPKLKHICCCYGFIMPIRSVLVPQIFPVQAVLLPFMAGGCFHVSMK